MKAKELRACGHIGCKSFMWIDKTGHLHWINVIPTHALNNLKESEDGA